MWEQRWHPLREEWVIVAAHRQSRPWSGAEVGARDVAPPAYDPSCYLCPGNARVSGRVNPQYTGTFVFDNDHPCVGSDAPRTLAPPPGIYRNGPATGVARVVCYSPRHDVTLAELDVSGVDALLATWQDQMRELAAHPDVALRPDLREQGRGGRRQQPAPALPDLRHELRLQVHRDRTARRQTRHLAETGRVLFQDVLAAERQDGRRIISEQGERDRLRAVLRALRVRGLCRARCGASPTIADLDDAERRDLAAVLRDVVIRFDNLWRMPFPYVMALHQAPVKGTTSRGFHFHIEFHPPLRRPNLLKYLAGPEIGGGNFLSDTCAGGKGRGARSAAGGTALQVDGSRVTHPLRRSDPRRCTGASAPTSWPPASGGARIAVRTWQRRGGRHDLRHRSGRRARADRGDRPHHRQRHRRRWCSSPKGCRAAASWCPEGAIASRAAWTIIVDPIDGTRGLMYQKRPGWILTGVAGHRPAPRPDAGNRPDQPQRPEPTRLSDIEVRGADRDPAGEAASVRRAVGGPGQGAHGAHA